MWFPPRQDIIAVRTLFNSSASFAGETIYRTLTLPSYRLFTLTWATNATGQSVWRTSRAARNFPFPEIDLPCSGARGCMGVLELPRTRRRFACPRHEHGRVVHRDAPATGRGCPDKAAFSGARRADSRRRCRAACKIRRRNRGEIHGAQ